MRNELFMIGPTMVYGYGLMIAIGIMLAYLLAEYRARRIGLDDEAVFGLTCWAVVGGLLGGKVLYYLTILPQIAANPAMLFQDLAYGFVIYGALIGGVLGVILYCRWRKLNALSYFDLAVPSVAMAQGFGRIGCILAGCCYGRETSGPLFMVFHGSDYAPNGIPLIPTQAISSVLNFAHFALLLVFAKKYKKGEGQVAGLFFILYSIGRFFLEFLRGDMERGSVGALSTSQFISLFMFLFGCVLFWVLGKRGTARAYGKKAAAAVSIIGGADGPTSVFLAGKTGDDPKGKARREERMRKIAERIPAAPHTIQETEQYLTEKYAALLLSADNPEVQSQEKSMRVNMVFRHRPDLLKTPEPEFPKSKKNLEAFEEQIRKRFQEAEEISAEELPLDLCQYRIVPKDHPEAVLNFVVERSYGVFQVSSSYGKGGEEEQAALEEIIKDVYLYYGVSQEDKEQFTERFLMLASVVGEL